MTEQSSASGILRSMPWPAAEAFTALLTGAASMFIIARLIGADEFGRGSIALGLILISLVGVNSLVHDALVRMPDMQPEDLDTGFTASFAVAMLFMLVIILGASTIGNLYADHRLALLIVAFTPMLPLAALSETLIATYRRGLDFGTVARFQIASRAAGAVLGIVIALLHGGAWAMAVQNVSMAAFSAGAMLFHAKRWPHFGLSWPRLTPMLGFCAPIIASQILTQGTGRMLLLAMGHWHGITMAGYWSAATRMSENLFGGLMQAAYNVSLAHFSINQNSRSTLLASLRDVQAVTALLSIPILAGLAVVTRPLTLLLLGPAWLPVATLMLGPLVVCFLQIRRMFPTTALRAVGRSGISLVASLAEFTTLAIAFLAVGRQSAVDFSFVYPLGLLAGSIPVFALLVRELGTSVWAQVATFLKEIAIGIVAFGVGTVALSSFADSAIIIQLIMGGGAAFVTAASLLVLTDARHILRIAGAWQHSN